MQVQNPEEYNPENYGCYAVTSIVDEFVVHKIYPDGPVEYLDYDIYSIGNKKLLAFKKFNIAQTDYVYVISSSTETEQIDFQTYENFKDVIDGSYDVGKNIFIIMNSVSMPDVLSAKKYEGILSEDKRCDNDTFGPDSFRDLDDGSGLTIVDYTEYLNSGLDSTTCIFNSMGNIHVLRTQFKKDLPDEAYRNRAGVSGNARTITLALKMVYDWAQCSKSPWNDQSQVAIKCSNFIDEIKIPDEVIEELKSFQIASPIELYLSGDDNPRAYKEEILEMPPLFKKWFLLRIRYQSLNSLFHNYPEKLDIDSTMLEKEKSFFNEVIEYYCMTNNLDSTSITGKEIISHYGELFSEKNLTRDSILFDADAMNSVPNVALKNIY